MTATVRTPPHDPDAALRRFLRRILDGWLLDDGAALRQAVRAEAERLGLDPAPRPAEAVADFGGDDVALLRFLQAVREADFAADAIRDEVADEMDRLALADALLPAPGDAILHIPADRLEWCAGQWWARPDDLETHLPPGRPLPDADDDGRRWPPVTPSAMADALRAAGMDSSEVRPIVGRYREHLRVRWGIQHGGQAGE